MHVIFPNVSVIKVVIFTNFWKMKMTEIDRDNDRYKNDRDMMGVLYRGVWGVWGGRCIITTTTAVMISH